MPSTTGGGQSIRVERSIFGDDANGYTFKGLTGFGCKCRCLGYGLFLVNGIGVVKVRLS